LRRGTNNIKRDLEETGRESVDWIDLAQDREQFLALLKTLMKILVQINGGKYLNSYETISFL
jgi:hypothetical protein